MSTPTTASVPVSFNIITKDQVGPTAKAVESIIQQVFREGDEILVLDTGSEEGVYAELQDKIGKIPGVALFREDLCENLGPYIDEWLDDKQKEQFGDDEQYRDLRGTMNFAALRQRCAELSKHDIICWIDSDDVLIDESNGGLRRLVDEYIGSGEGSAIFLDYRYAFAEDGTCTTILKRERFVDRTKFKWVGRCHETLIPIVHGSNPNVGYWQELPAYVSHTEAKKKGIISDVRNYIILRRELEEMPEGALADPRTVFYLGNAARGLGKYEEAIDLYKTFDTASGSVDDRFAAATYVAGIYMTPQYQRPIEAADWYDKCIELKGYDPRGYFGKARCYLALARYEESLHWYGIGCKLPFPDDCVHSVDPTQILYHPHLIASIAAKELGRNQEAVEFAARAKNARPDFTADDQHHRVIHSEAAAAGLTDAVIHVLRHCKDKPNADVLASEIADRIQVVPPRLERMGLGRMEGPDPREPQPEIAIICGETLEPWGPASAKTGIGGSEKMVLLLAPRLQARGYNVTVYNNCPFHQRGVGEDGVRWEHWSALDPKRPRAVAVYWRNKSMVTQIPCAAEKRFVWLHDVQNPAEYTGGHDWLEAVDYVQFQSKYHTAPLEACPGASKYWLARNAIETSLYDPSQSDPKKIIYCSCPSRGLFTALSVFSLAKELDPELSMDICYGFTPFYRKATARSIHCHIPDIARDASRDDYERMVNAMIDRTGAKMHHRVSFQECAEIQNKAGIWLYPTRFPEISCMAAMETQAAGCIPVATRYGALDETIGHQDYCLPDVPVPTSDDFLAAAARQVLEAAKIPGDSVIRNGISDSAKDRFCADALADAWVSKIKE